MLGGDYTSVILKHKKAVTRTAFSNLVPEAGLEPARYF